MRFASHPFHITLHALIAREVLVDVGLRHPAVEPEIAREPEFAHPVYESEVDHLRHAALVGRNVLHLASEDFRRGCAVNVFAARKGGEKPFVAREMRHDAKFDLRIVGRDDDGPRFRNEGFAHAPAFFGSHRNVLEIRIHARQTPRHGGRLAKGRVHAPVARAHHLRELVEVGPAKLGETTVFENDLGERIVVGEFGQHLFVRRMSSRRGLLLGGKAHFLKEHLRELHGTREIEGVTRQCVGLSLEFVDAKRKFGALFGEALHVDVDPVFLHSVENAEKRPLDRPIDRLEPLVVGELAREHAPERAKAPDLFGQQPPEMIPVLKEVARRAALRALSENRLARGEKTPQPSRREFSFVVRQMRFEDVAHEHRVVERSAHRDPFAPEIVKGRLRVVDHLRRAGRKPRSEGLYEGRFVEEVQGQHVVHKRLQRKGDSHPIGVVGRSFPKEGERHGRLARVGLERFEDLPPAVGKDLFVEHFVGQSRLEEGGRLTTRRGLFFFKGGRNSRGLERVFERRLCGRRIEGEAPRGRAVQSRHRHFPTARKGGGRLRVGGLHEKSADVVDARHLAVALDRDERAGVLEKGESRAEVFADLSLHVRGVRDDAVERPVLGDPLRRRLRAALFDSGHVVDLVAHERKVVDDSLGVDPVLLHHALTVVELVVHGVEKDGLVVHKLRHVLVARGDDGVEAQGFGTLYQRRDHVVGFHARNGQNRPAELLDDFAQRPDLHAQIVGHGRTVRLVFGKAFVAEVAPGRIEDDRRVVGLREAPYLAEHPEKTLHGSGRFVRARTQVGETVIGAKEVVGAVDQENLCHVFLVGRKSRWRKYSGKRPSLPARQ